MVKLDVRHALHLCHVYISDWLLLGFYWDKQYSVETRLYFQRVRQVGFIDFRCLYVFGMSTFII